MSRFGQAGEQVVCSNPFYGGDADCVAEPKQSLVKRDCYFIAIINPLQPGTLSRGQQADLVSPFARFEKNLATASATRRAETTGKAICAKFGH